MKDVDSNFSSPLDGAVSLSYTFIPKRVILVNDLVQRLTDAYICVILELLLDEGGTGCVVILGHY